MNLILQFVQAIRRSMLEAHNDPREAALSLEHAISNAVEIDSSLLFSLDPASMAMILEVSAVDPNVISYVVHSLMLEASYLELADQEHDAQLRHEQAKSVAHAYGIDIDMEHFKQNLNDFSGS